MVQMMNKVKVFLLTILLSSCSLLPDPFDNVEYMHLIHLNILAGETEDCQTSGMRYYSQFLQRYSEGTLNTNTAEIYAQIDSLVTELSSRENPSTGYCILKKQSIVEITDEAIETFGGRFK